MTGRRETFSIQIDESLLKELRALAASEERQIQHLVDEAVSDLLEKRKSIRARPHALAAFGQSHGRFGSLYDKLAK